MAELNRRRGSPSDGGLKARSERHDDPGWSEAPPSARNESRVQGAHRGASCSGPADRKTTYRDLAFARATERERRSVSAERGFDDWASRTDIGSGPISFRRLISSQSTVRRFNRDTHAETGSGPVVRGRYIGVRE
jgi:hypothetical protein